MDVEITQNEELSNKENYIFHYKLTDEKFGFMSLKDFYELQHSLLSYLAVVNDIYENGSIVTNVFNVFKRDAIEFVYPGYYAKKPNLLISSFLRCLAKAFDLTYDGRLVMSDPLRETLGKLITFAKPGLITGVLQYNLLKTYYIKDYKTDPTMFFISDKFLPLIVKYFSYYKDF